MRYDRLMDQLQGCMAAEDQNFDSHWHVGSECVVYVGKDSRWYRAIISEINANQYKVCEVKSSKLSPWGDETICPPANGSLTRCGSAFVRRRVRSLHMAKLQAAIVPIA